MNGTNESGKIIEWYEKLRQRYRVFAKKGFECLDDLERLEFRRIRRLLSMLEKALPDDYFSAEKSLARFWARPDVQELLKNGTIE